MLVRQRKKAGKDRRRWDAKLSIGLTHSSPLINDEIIHSLKMTLYPLITALSKLLNCEPKNLTEYLNHPGVHQKVEEFLRGKKLKTTYLDKEGKRKDVKFGEITLKSASELYAFEGFLGIFPIHY